MRIFVDCSQQGAHDDLKGRFGVEGYPTLVLADSAGNRISSLVGNRPADQVRQALQAALGAAPASGPPVRLADTPGLADLPPDEMFDRVLERTQDDTPLRIGNRVRLHLINDNVLLGKVAFPATLSDEELKAIQDPFAFDYEKQAVVTLDVTLEYPGLGNGASLTVPRSMVRCIESLRPLSAEELSIIRATMQRAQEKLEQAEAERRAQEQSRLQALDEARRRADEERKKAEEALAASGDVEAMKQALEFYYRFPREQGWDEDRLAKIMNKTKLRLTPTPDEQEFVSNFALWKKADDFLQELRRKTGKETPQPQTP